MYYDYYGAASLVRGAVFGADEHAPVRTGFPPESYEVKYDAPGAPELAQRVSSLLTAAGIKNSLDAVRPRA
jgi:aromatic ring-opening dioxygenase catalytic subunit (LigB family)